MRVFAGLGSNIGNREENLKYAIIQLSDTPGVALAGFSKVKETEPYGFSGQPEFLNQILALETDLSPLDLLNTCQEIERKAGRIRTVKWGPRTLDIDILFYGDTIIHSDRLSIPHPDLHNRRFILQAMLELNPDLIHPVLKKNIKELLQELLEKL